MKITLDRVLGLLGVIFAIPALLELVRPERTREGILLSALAVLIFGYLIYRRCEEKQPLFTYLASLGKAWSTSAPSPSCVKTQFLDSAQT